MSWKSVEMQVALPRTQDVGKVQEQLHQRGKVMQESLASNQLVTEDLKRKKVNDSEQKDQVKNKKQESNSQYSTNNIKSNHTEESDLRSKHPYLGKQIDYNG
ncbi:hypothetical protein NC661_15895 [Aquibacillus koreensis]|uniref:Uncharacterized protein n=1 Tax=Aquibacillus koreensis TaxID=279446 RepID=A0A9X3WKM5_9BACI|nr:hypothetical protein [Aquibacillus koreensis]MCT2534549.1 hypothetical protein [Aquibacillus koreensis]MDC3421857.1 hypothetical protein [Aquibacillus koreensis]